MRILLLEDDPGQAELYQALLVRAGHACALFATAQAFLAQVRSQLDADVLVIDWMLPDMVGEEVLRALRRDLRLTIPVVVLTVRDEESVVVRALEAGADDFVVKPAKPREFLARLQALARRAGQSSSEAVAAPNQIKAPQQLLNVGAFQFDLLRRVVSAQGAQIDLTTKEYDLAAYLFAQPGALHSRATLLDAVWGVSADVETRTVDTHVSRLRRRLHLDGRFGVRLAPVYGFGYRLEVQ